MKAKYEIKSRLRATMLDGGTFTDMSTALERQFRLRPGPFAFQVDQSFLLVLVSISCHIRISCSGRNSAFVHKLMIARSGVGNSSKTKQFLFTHAQCYCHVARAALVRSCSTIHAGVKRRILSFSLFQHIKDVFGPNCFDGIQQPHSFTHAMAALRTW